MFEVGNGVLYIKYIRIMAYVPGNHFPGKPVEAEREWGTRGQRNVKIFTNSRGSLTEVSGNCSFKHKSCLVCI